MPQTTQNTLASSLGQETAAKIARDVKANAEEEVSQ